MVQATEQRAEQATEQRAEQATEQRAEQATEQRAEQRAEQATEQRAPRAEATKSSELWAYYHEESARRRIDMAMNDEERNWEDERKYRREDARKWELALVEDD